MRKLVLVLFTLLSIQQSFSQSRLSQTLKSLPGRGLTHHYHHVTSIKQNVTSSVTIPLAVGNYTILAGGEYPSLQEFSTAISLKSARVTEVTETGGKLIQINIRVNVAADHTFSIYNKKSADSGGEEYVFIIVAKDNNAVSTGSTGNANTFMSDRQTMNINGAASLVSENSYKASSSFAITSNESLYKANYEFNRKGFLTKKFEEFSECNPCKFTYGQDGKKTSMGNEGKTFKLRYSRKGSLLAEEQFELEDSDDMDTDFDDLEQYGVKSYLLDEQGRIKEETEYYDNEMKDPMSRTRQSYDSQGRLTMLSFEEFNDDTEKWEVLKKAVFSNFDEKGNPRAEEHLDEKSSPYAKMTISYVYDSQNNWTEKRLKVTSKNEDGQWQTEYFVTKRVIKY